MNSFTHGFLFVIINWVDFVLAHPRISLVLSLIGMAIFYAWLFTYFPTTAITLFIIGIVLNIASYLFLNQ